MNMNISYNLIASVLIIGIMLLAGGLYASYAWGYFEDTVPGTSERLTLGQWVYYQEDGQPRHYMGDLLGVYTVGTMMCMLYDMTGSYPDVTLNCYTGDNPAGHESGWLRENGWGILVNAFPKIDLYGQGDLIPSSIYGLWPIMIDGSFDRYALAEITGSDASLGHEWTPFSTDMTSAGRLGVELVLHPAYEYPGNWSPLHD